MMEDPVLCFVWYNPNSTIFNTVKFPFLQNILWLSTSYKVKVFFHTENIPIYNLPGITSIDMKKNNHYMLSFNKQTNIKDNIEFLKFYVLSHYYQMFQNETNPIFLLNMDCRIQRKNNEKIISEPFEVSYYNNSKKCQCTNYDFIKGDSVLTTINGSKIIKKYFFDMFKEQNNLNYIWPQFCKDILQLPDTYDDSFELRNTYEVNSYFLNNSLYCVTKYNLEDTFNDCPLYLVPLGNIELQKLYRLILFSKNYRDLKNKMIHFKDLKFNFKHNIFNWSNSEQKHVNLRGILRDRLLPSKWAKYVFLVTYFDL